jgi:hypothetical protein
MFPKPLMEKFTDRIVHGATRWQRLLSPGRAEKIATGSGSIVQVQMLFETKHELSDAENANLEAMFVEAAKRLRARAADLKLKPQ